MSILKRNIMKPSKTEFFSFFGDSGYKTRWLSYTVLFLLSAILGLYCFVFGQSQTSPDSFDYMRASELLGAGELHRTRPPVYPCILLILRYVVGKTYLFAAVRALQYVIFFISIIYFSKIARAVIPSLKGAFWTSAAYALLPSFASFNNCILTESLCVSFVIFFIWTLVQALHEKK